MNDQRFFDLAMKNIAQQATDAERAELDTLLTSHPELKAELEKLRTDALLTREVLPLAAAAESSTAQFPAYARERLQTKVRQTLGAAPEATDGKRWNWRWLAGLAAATAVIVLLVLPSPTRDATVIQVAMLDTAGVVRGADTNDITILQRHWPVSSVETFSGTDALKSWQGQWPDGNFKRVKVLYDRAAGEVHVFVRGAGKPKVFVVDPDLAETLREVDKFVRQQSSEK